MSITTNNLSRFPKSFFWGVATAGHQVEGNNTNADIAFLEHRHPTVFQEPSNQACNSYELWETDLDLVQKMGLNCFRFSLEWARIEPQPGKFSADALHHYLQIIQGCEQRHLTPIVTLCHFASPIWFAAQGGWTHPQAPEWFGRFVKQVCATMGAHFSYVITFNEPNILLVLESIGMPDCVWDLQDKMLDQAAQDARCEKFTSINVMKKSDFAATTAGLIQGHKLARDIIHNSYPNVQVGISLAVVDDQPAGPDSLCDTIRQKNYAAWLAIAEHCDFYGVQNYEKREWTATGALEPPATALTNASGGWIDPTSLRHSVEYLYAQTGKPILISEHGVATDDDTLRQTFLRDSLVDLSKLFEQSIPLLGYIHWSLIDNFEWISGFSTHFGLYSFDPQTFIRHAKGSAQTYQYLVAQARC